MLSRQEDRLYAAQDLRIVLIPVSLPDSVKEQAWLVVHGWNPERINVVLPAFTAITGRFPVGKANLGLNELVKDWPNLQQQPIECRCR